MFENDSYVLNILTSLLDHKYQLFEKLHLDLNVMGDISCNIKIDNDFNTQFWLDRWHSDTALAFSFSHLFNICINPHITVFEAVMFRGIALNFSNQLSCMLIIDLNVFYQIIGQCELSLESDSLLWRWHTSVIFSTHSSYQ
jgi:hypothetical protein